MTSWVVRTNVRYDIAGYYAQLAGGDLRIILRLHFQIGSSRRTFGSSQELVRSSQRAGLLASFPSFHNALRMFHELLGTFGDLGGCRLS